MLVETIELLLAVIEPELVSEGQAARVRSTAAALPPVLRGGFEVRLAASEPQVDLQLCVRPDEADSTAVSHLLGPEFVRAWREPDDPDASIEEVWLEADADPAAPSIFVALPRTDGGSPDGRAWVGDALAYLLGARSGAGAAATLGRLREACPGSAWVSHVAAMRGRAEAALRVNIKDLGAPALPSFLDALGWSGSTEAPGRVMTELARHVDRVTVGLDVTDEVAPRIGFECSFRDHLEEGSRSGQFLQKLVADGLCDPTKRDALFRWPGWTTPNDAKAPWPEGLIIAALGQPRDRFSAFARNLSHFKVTWDEEGLGAKAYLWFEHEWYDASALGAPVTSAGTR